MANQPPSPGQKNHREEDGGNDAVDQGAGPTRATVPPPRRQRLQEKGDAESAGSHGPVLLPAAIGPRSD